MNKKTLIKNANVLALDDKHTKGNFILVEKGLITGIGQVGEFREISRHCDKVIDLKGRTVLPGFSDTHVHLIMTGLRPQQLELKECEGLDDIIDRIRAWEKKTPGLQWICGWGVDDTKFKDKRMPYAADLDRAGVKRPVWVARMDGNSCSVNSIGLKKIKYFVKYFGEL